MLCGTGPGRRSRNDQIDLETRQFSRQSRQPIDHSIGRSVFDDDVLTLYVAVFPQSLSESLNSGLSLGIRQRAR